MKWEWDGTSNYVSPVKVGDRVIIRFGVASCDSMEVRGRVAKVEGYAPGVLELDNNVRVALDGPDTEFWVMPPTRPRDRSMIYEFPEGEYQLVAFLTALLDLHWTRS